MRVICSQEMLAPALSALSKLAKHEWKPLSQRVLLTATYARTSMHDTLSLLGTGRGGTVGMVKQIPAMVQEEGQTLVLINPLAEYVNTLRPGELTLSQSAQEASGVQEPLADNRLLSLAPQEAAPLCIDSTFRSSAGTASMSHASFARTWVCQPAAIPPVQEWLSACSAPAILSAPLFREAIALCAPVAMRDKETAAMYGVLVRVEGERITCTATTGLMLVSHTFSLKQPAPEPFTGLFAGSALAWIRQVLPTAGDLALALTTEGEHGVLLISAPRITLFCRSLPGPLPTVWEQPLYYPHETEWLLKRQELVGVLKCLAIEKAEGPKAVALSVEGTALVIKEFPERGTSLQEQHLLQLLQPSARLEILVDREQFTSLVRKTPQGSLRLHIGSFERVIDQQRKTIRFLRIPAGCATLMMSISELPGTHEERDGSTEQQMAEQREAVPAAEA